MQDPNMIQQIIHAANILTTPPTTPDMYAEFKSADAYLRKFQEVANANELMMAAYGMFQKQTESQCLYGLLFLETVVKKYFDSMATKESKTFLDDILKLTFTYSQFLKLRPFKEKLGQIISSIMKRKWPAKLEKDFLENVLIGKLASYSIQSFELVLVVLKELALEVSPDCNSDLDPRRATEITLGLKARSDKVIFPFLQKKFSELSVMYKEAVSKQQQGMVLELRRAVLAVLEVHQAFISKWVPITHFFKFKFPNDWFALILDDAFWETASENIFLFCSLKWSLVSGKKRKNRNGGRMDKSLIPFLENFCETFEMLIATTANNPQCYELHLKLAKATSAMLEINGPCIFMNKGKIVSDVGKLLVTLSTHPSLKMFLELCPAWEALCEDKAFQKKEFEPLIENIYELCYVKCLKQVGNPENKEIYKGNQTTAFAFKDFPDLSEYLNAFGNICRTCRTILQNLTKQNPGLSCRYFSHLSSILMSQYPKANPQVEQVTNEGKCTVKSVTYLKWDAFASIAGWMMTPMKENDKNLKKRCQGLAQPCAALMKFETDDPLIQSRVLECLCQCFPLYTHNPEALKAFLNFAHKNMTINSGKDVKSLSDDVKSLRRKAFKCVVFLSETIPQVLLPSLNSLLSQAESMYNENIILQDELVIMYEALLLLSFSINDYAKQLEFIRYLLGSHAQKSKEKETLAFVSNLTLLLQALELIPMQNPEQKPQLEKILDAVRFALTIFTSTAHRLPKNSDKKGNFQSSTGSGQYPVSELLVAILPMTAKLIGTLHQIYDPQVSQKLPQDSQQILRYGFLEDKTAHALGETYAATHLSPQQSALKKKRHHLKSIQSLCYDLMGQVCIHAAPQVLYGNQHTLQFLLGCVFKNFSLVPLDDLEKIVQLFIRPFAQNCPPEAFILLDQVLQGAYKEIYDRIDQGWQVIHDSKEGNSVFSPKEEIVYEIALRSLQKTSLSVLEWITSCLQKKDFREPSPICQWFLQSSILPITLAMCIRIFNSPDTTLISPTAKFMETLLPHIVKNQAYERTIAGEMLYSLIHALMVFRENVHPSLYRLITLIYVKYIQLGSKYPCAIFLQLPKIEERDLRKFNSSLERVASHKKAFSRQKNMVRGLIKTVAGVREGEFKKKVVLPNDFDVNKPLKKSSEVDLNGIGNLFK